MDDWDSIDWDERLADEKAVDTVNNQQKQQQAIQNENISLVEFHDDDGNYYNEIQAKKSLNKIQNPTKLGSSSRDTRSTDGNIFIQCYSTKDLVRIRNYTNDASETHLLIYETFGQFEKFLLTHQQDLTHETIVELLTIDVALLQIPFQAHNKQLLENVAQVASFWSQTLEFVKEFLEVKHKDMKFLLVVDMNGFFANLESLLHNLLVTNLFNPEVEYFFNNILDLMEASKDSEWNNAGRLRRLKAEYERNVDVFKIYDVSSQTQIVFTNLNPIVQQVYPSLIDLNLINDNLSANIMKGEYESVSHYLQVQLPLLKEDFISKLRDGCAQLKSMTNKVVKTPNVWIHQNVQILAVRRSLWNMECPLIVVQLKLDSIDIKRRFFNGQMLCFTSSKNLEDLVVAVILKRDLSDKQNVELIIEIIKTENITDIFGRDFIMIEPVSFFEPYHRVFNVMKNFNELNFPFKQQIIKLGKTQQFPDYPHADHFIYKDFTFQVENINKWPTNDQLSLEVMQHTAIHKAVTSDFSIIQGPPGTGKTFIGLEILKILLENTSETILVLTQTNSALDKFLLGASKFTDSIARLGGQSKCEELERFVVKASTMLESTRYIKKLQAQHREEVAALMKTNGHEEIYRKISTLHRSIDEIHQLSSFYSISQKRIVGMTTTFAARNVSINQMLKPGIVIIEEASEVLESHVLVSLTRRTKQVIMIGDHQQLRPLTNSYDLAKNYNFNISLFERLTRNDFNYITLDVQMRMKSEICDLVRGTIYGGLKDGANVTSLPNVKGMTRSLFCVDHSHPESVGDGETSKENAFEAKSIVTFCNSLIRKGNKASQITILTAYAAQAQRITERIKDFPDRNVRVAVLDAYQGEESDIILLSLVRSNPKCEIGFLASENRIAVLLSRAKFGFYIFANMNCLASASPTWKKVRSILEAKDAIGAVFWGRKEFMQLMPDIDIK